MTGLQVPLAEPLADISEVPASDHAADVEVPDEWEIKPEELKVGPRIGFGSFGEVYRGSWRYTDVAVKKLIDQELSPSLLEVGSPYRACFNAGAAGTHQCLRFPQYSLLQDCATLQPQTSKQSNVLRLQSFWSCCYIAIQHCTISTLFACHASFPSTQMLSMFEKGESVAVQEFRRETGIMKRLRHVNVLLFLGAISQPPHMAIITQYMPRGSLFRLMHR